MKPLHFRMLGLGLTTSLLFTSCSTNPQPAFNDVGKTVSARSGTTVRWIQSQAQADEIHNTVRALLQTNLSVRSSVQIALLNSPTLQATFEEIGLSHSELVQAGLFKNPQFAARWRFPNQPLLALDSEYSIAMDFLDLLVLPLRKQVSARSLEQTKLRVAQRVLSLVAEVQSAFYTVQAREQLLKSLRLIVELNEAAADLARRQHDAGNLTDLDLANQETIYAQSKVMAASTEKELRTDRERINRLLGLWGPDTLWTVADELPALPPQEIPVDQLESLAIGQRLDLAAARQQVDAVGLALALRTRTRFVPAGIMIGVDSEQNVDGTPGLRLTGPTLALELPIFDQGQAAIARLGAQYRQAQRALEASAVNIRSEVRQARDLMIANRDLAQHYDKVLLPLRRQIVSQTQLQYNAMQMGTYNLLLAKEAELETERDYVQSWRDYWIARADLERAVGGRLLLEPTTSEGIPAAQKPSTAEKEKAGESHQHHP